MPLRRALFGLGLALLLLAGLQAFVSLAQAPDEPWLVRLPCRDEAELARLLGTGARVLLWERAQAYALADSEQRTRIAALGLTPELLVRGAARGDYFVVWAAAAEVQSLSARYGKLVALGDGFYLLGLPPLAPPLSPAGPRFARRLPNAITLPQGALRPPKAPSPPARQLATLAGQVSQDRLRQTITDLQDDDARPGPDALGSRYTMVEGLDRKGAYIAGELKAAGLEVSYFPFSATDYASQVTRMVSNVVGILPGLHPESEGFYILCAHYDSTASHDPRWYSQATSLPAPGADDDASGVAGLLETARILSRRQLAHPVRFVAFAGEEQGLQGSEAYAASLQSAGASILGVVDLDMIAYDGSGGGRVEVHAGTLAASQELAQVLVANMEHYAPSLHPVVKTTTASDGSDHAPFWHRGYPAVLAIEDWANHTPYYHTISDTLSSLNLPFCTDIVRAAVAAVGELAQVQAPDLSRSEQSVTLAGPLLANVNYTITLRNTGTVTATATLTDVLGAGLGPSGSPWASTGVATWDWAGHTLRWQGEIAPHATVTLTCQASLDPAWLGGVWIETAAVLDDGLGQTYTLPTRVRSPWRLRLPIAWGWP